MSKPNKKPSKKTSPPAKKVNKVKVEGTKEGKSKVASSTFSLFDLIDMEEVSLSPTSGAGGAVPAPAPKSPTAVSVPVSKPSPAEGEERLPFPAQSVTSPASGPSARKSASGSSTSAPAVVATPGSGAQPDTRRPVTKERFEQILDKNLDLAPSEDELEGEERSDPTQASPSPQPAPSSGVPSVASTSPPTDGATAASSSRMTSALNSKLGAAFNRPTNKAPHVIVIARAGTGKTFTLIEGMKLVKGLPVTATPSPQQRAVWDRMLLSKGARSVCFAAFNNSIASELQARVPPGCDAMTLHKMGFKAVLKSFPGLKDVGDNLVSKRGKLTEQLILSLYEGVESWKDLLKSKAQIVTAVKPLVEMCKSNLVDGSSQDELYNLARRHEIDLPMLSPQVDECFALVPRVLDLCKDPLKNRQIEFADMIWLPVVLDLRVWEYDLLMVDEAQDMNRCQQALAKKAGRRLILVGDDRQAIYGFAGADSESIKRMESELTKSGVVVLPLTVTRRCGKAIVKEAKRIVPDFEAHETNPEGKVKEARYPIQYKDPRSRTTYELDYKDTYLPLVQDGDMVLCRSNAPLVKQWLKFVKNGRNAFINGRELGDTLAGLITKMEASNVTHLIEKLTEWLRGERSKEQAKDEPDERWLEQIQDRYDCCLCFTEGAESVSHVLRKIDEAFTAAKEGQGIKLSSIHKAKGLESRRVFYLRPDVHPTRPLDKMPAWAAEQELNLEYVAITRAIEELTYVY